MMKRTLLAALLILCSLPFYAQQKHTFTTQGNHFALDGQPFKVLSGELHYERIPRAYWHARLKMAKAMGLNTIATYVFWNMHKPIPGHFDFTGNNDVAAFIRAAQKEGLYVILRTGPYSCAEWDLGGLPAWLLKDPASAAALRSNDPAFMVPAERWIDRLAKELTPLQIGRGGPILMTQVENEYGNFGSDHVYMEHLHQIFLHAGFTDSLLYTADNWRNIPNGSIPGLYAATNFGIGNHQGGMDALAKLRPDAPLFVSEYWPGWFDSWGHPHETRPIGPQIEDLDYILKRGAGINIYMFHGGTSFGFMSGSSLIKGHFLPDVTSYDYDAPLDEAGHTTPKFFAYRKVLAQFSPCGNESCLPPVPAAPQVITIPQIDLTQSTPLWANLPAPIHSELPKPMEHFDQSYGYILYRTQLPAHTHGDLVIDQVHDYAQIYLNGKLTATLDRRFADPQGNLPPVSIKTNGPARLDILVADDGRINSTRNMRGEAKGITHAVTLAGQPLTNWQVYPLPMTTTSKLVIVTLNKSKGKNPRSSPEVPQSAPATPIFFRATFTLASTGDTFLDIRDLGKGALWINGHAIGRFWNTGPQQTLYVPGPWLRKGRNQITIFDMAPQSVHPHVAGLAQPILNGPVADQTTSNQQ
ncbi:MULTISPECIES: beta-galactosidase [Acidobacteriaceae]|uniref:glycoside hydrolase family 35 protein n=1 Tax=Acidobacteriaceae TaxID=204434 RepID=UPI00131E6B94|nr:MULTISPECIES: beta-galactosidase [Acidobacteriaceae]MDW5266891.1 beta-galactosidase [Edaphobacter sp.]